MKKLQKSGLLDAIFDELRSIKKQLSEYKDISDNKIEVYITPGLSNLADKVSNLKMVVEGGEEDKPSKYGSKSDLVLE